MSGPASEDEPGGDLTKLTLMREVERLIGELAEARSDGAGLLEEVLLLRRVLGERNQSLADVTHDVRLLKRLMIAYLDAQTSGKGKVIAEAQLRAAIDTNGW